MSLVQKFKPKNKAPKNIQEVHDIALLRKVSKKKIPSVGQLRYLHRVLTSHERNRLLISILILIVASSVLSARIYARNTESVATNGGTYTEGLVGSPRFINPLLSSGNDVDRDLSSLVFSGLLHFDADGNIAPDLASQYRVSADQKEYTVELKDDLVWHDGEPLTIDDVFFTIQTIQDPAFKSPLRVSFSGVTVNRIDRRTISFSLKEPFPSFLQALTVGLIPQHIWYSIPSAQAHLAEANIKPIGSGPYKFKTLTKDSNGTIRNITLARNEQYHSHIPYIDQLTFKFYPDVGSAIEALQNKNVEGLGFLPLQNKAQLEGNTSIKLHLLDLPQHRTLFFNPGKNALLNDKNIRRAIAFAIDRQRIVTEALGGNGTPITTLVLPGYTADENSEDPYSFSPSEAVKILEDDEWVLNEETGIRTKNETELAITITTVDQQENVQAASIIKENLEAIGIKTTIAIIEKSRIKNDIIETRNYEVLLFGQITTSNQDVYAFWHSSQTSHPGNNLSVFANKDIDAALESLRNTTDLEKQRELYQTFVNKLSAEMFAVFLYTPTYIYPVNKKIKGLENLLHVSSPSDRFNGIEKWYIKTKRERI